MAFDKKNLHVLLAVVLLLGSVFTARTFASKGMFDGLFVSANSQLSLASIKTTTTGVEQVLFVGGSNLSPTLNETFFNDVYTTTNMQNWNLASPNDPTSTTKWSPRRSVEGFYFQDKYWILGGAGSFSNSPTPNDVWNSVDGTSWTKVSTTPPPFRNYMNYRATVFNGMIYVVGGYLNGNNSASQSYVWSSPDGINWTVITAPFSSRYNESLIVYKSKLYVIGGFSAKGSVGSTPSLGDIWSTTDGNTWNMETLNLPWGTIASATPVVQSNKIFLVAGEKSILNPNGTYTQSTLNTIWSSVDGINWTLVSNASPVVGFNPDTVVAGGKIWVVDNRLQGINKLYSSVDGTNWLTSCISLPFSPRAYHKMISNGGTQSIPSDPCTPPSSVCKIDSFIVPASTTISSGVSVTTSWSSNCSNVILEANSGSYTLRHVGGSSGTHTFVAPPGTTFSSTDKDIHITLIAGNGIDTISDTKSVLITDVPNPASNQCAFTSLNATPNPVNSGSSVNLSWTTPAGCIVYVESWTPGTSGLAVVKIFKPRTYYFNSVDSVSVPMTKSTTYYISAQVGTASNTGSTMVLSAKAIDVKVQ